MAPSNQALVLKFPSLDVGCALPPRSRLFALEPIGIGTPAVESLVSYVIRLSAAHSVNPRRLIRTQFVRAIPEIAQLLSAAFFRQNARTVNAHGAYAGLFARATTALTGIGCLEQLTLLPVARLLPPNGEGLIARTLRWCPECLAEAVCNLTPGIYRPLAWSFQHYRVCTTHRCLLSDRCSHCGSHQDVFPRYPSMAHCSQCGTWLGGKGETPGTQLSDSLWISVAIEDVILHLQQLEAIGEMKNFARFVAQAVNGMDRGSHKAFCNAVGAGTRISEEWVAGRKASFPYWVAIAYALQTLPSSLFLISETAIQVDHALQSFPEQLQLKRDRPPRSEFAKREIATALAESSADPEDCRALSAIARQFQLDTAYLRRYWPAPCTLIQAKYRQAMKEKAEQRRNRDFVKLEAIFRGLVDKSEYPGGGKMNKQLRRQGMSLVRPELKKAYRDSIAHWSDNTLATLSDGDVAQCKIRKKRRV